MIIDAFIFFSELDLLEVRLGIMDPFVDRFVIVEADRTFQNKPKPLYFQDNRARFEPYWGKIDYVVVRDLPDGSNPWIREDFSRQAINRAVQNYSRDSILMLSDLDEIPDLRDWDRRTPTVWWHRFFYYYVNLEMCRIKGTVAITLNDYFNHPEIQGDAAKLRNWRHYNGTVLQGDRGGWHFSYLGGIEQIKKKINAFAHDDLVGYANDENLQKALGENWKRNIDLFNRDIYQFTHHKELDLTLPPYLLLNRDKYSHFWMPRESGS